MRGANAATVLRDVRQLFESGSVTGLSDQELLDRFLALRDPIALDVIIKRHGPAVLSVCRSIVRDRQAADDAFQATFLVLVQRAASIRVEGSLGPWLYGVSRRVAVRAARAMLKYQSREVPIVSELSDVLEHDEVEDREIARLLHAEIARLPASYRIPVLAHYFEGLTHEEAAVRLRCPLGTIKGRLARARRILRDRLARRGIGVTAGLLGTVLASEAKAALVASALRDSTARFVVVNVSTRSVVAAGMIPAVGLARGTLKAMFITKVVATASLLLVATTLLGTGVRLSLAADEGPAAKVAASKPVESTGAPANATTAGRVDDEPGRIDAVVERLQNEFRRLADLDKVEEAEAKKLEQRQLQLNEERKAGIERREKIRTSAVSIQTQLHDYTEAKAIRAAEAVREKEEARKTTYPVVYAIADLIGPPPTGNDQLQDIYGPINDLIRASVAPGTWKDGGDLKNAEPDSQGRVGIIAPFPSNSSLVIRHTAAVHEQIVERFRQLRRLRGLGAPEREATRAMDRRFRDFSDVTTSLSESKPGVRTNSASMGAIDYVICEGDMINIEKSGAKWASRVGSDGTVKLMKLGEVRVEGLGLRAARQKLLLHLRNVLQDQNLVLDTSTQQVGDLENPATSSKVRIWVSSGNRFAHVRGLVQKPGKVDASRGVPILDAIKSVGGLKNGVSRDSLLVKLSRVDIEGRVNDVFEFDLRTLTDSTDVLVMLPGDILDVRERLAIKTPETLKDNLDPKKVTSRDSALTPLDRSVLPPNDAYIVEPTDVLIVSVPKAKPDAPIQGERLVRPDGTISLGTYGDVQVSGLSVLDIKNKIATHLRKHLSDEALGIRDGRVETATLLEVRVAAVNSKFYYIQGEVESPGRYPLTENETVLDAIQKAGGLKLSANLSAIKLVRVNPRGPDFTPILLIDIKAMMNAGDTSTHQELKPGDRVIVPGPSKLKLVKADDQLRFESAMARKELVEERLRQAARLTTHPESDPAVLHWSKLLQKIRDELEQLTKAEQTSQADSQKSASVKMK